MVIIPVYSGCGTYSVLHNLFSWNSAIK